jgi:hypothetical protein
VPSIVLRRRATTVREEVNTVKTKPDKGLPLKELMAHHAELLPDRIEMKCGVPKPNGKFKLCKIKLI